MADVFISYAREDRARADQIASGLKAMGLEVFWDSEIPPGKTWADYIEEKLSQCKAMVVLWSAESTKSQWVREEARMGRDKGVLIPVMIDGASAPFGFGEVQAANLSTWRGEANNPDWVRFCNAVNTAVKGPGARLQHAPQAPMMSSAAMASSPSYAVDAAEQLSPPGYVMKCLRMYLNGDGRARRMEYWSFVLFYVLVLFAGVALDVGVWGVNSYSGVANAYWFTMLAIVGLVCPSTTVAIRRFHDVGVSGWWVLACYVTSIVYIGSLALLVVALIPGKPADNKYGPPAKAA